MQEYATCEALVKKDPRFIEALRRRGITDHSQVMVDPWCVGWFSEADNPTRRLQFPLVYLRRDLVGIAAGWFGQWGSGGKTEASRLGWLLIVATVPAVLVGFFIDETVELLLRHPLVIAAATIGFAVLLWWADRYRSEARTLSQLGFRDAVLIGVFQALALIPGTSRSGITITAGLMLCLLYTSPSPRDQRGCRIPGCA